ncbi:MurR/RpiR family transcriptional regulator [Spiroplasma sp. BIUS-1]|uniref:MurR/RpiR family transcriptional regulator n=1 Tax=Spiroplasma sp. BIUS-1 TaxID=216964 RepID=UPI0013988CAC|nr:MurR/RpiR family transcriptional regulator [Spiroplasma sp. BIUS-1]QHX36340.1 transcriptional regulator [Spiroplasma sp. BIUS-1]
MRSFLSKLTTIDDKDLTIKEKKIVEYIKTHLKEIVDTNMKIERMAQEAGTGYSAIYGLLKKLNIKGFRDFAISLANDAENQEINVAKNDENVVSGYINIIKQNYALIDKKSIFETLNIIKSSKKVFFCYWENLLSGPAQELSNFFYKNGYNVYLLDSDQETIRDRIKTSNEDDVFVFFTRYGNSTRLDNAIKELGEMKRKVVYISGKVASYDINKYLSSIHTLIVDNPDTSIFKGHISHSVPFNYFNDLLIYHFLNSEH